MRISRAAAKPYRAPPIKEIAAISLQHLTQRREKKMSLLKWALIFLIVSLVAAVFGFTGIAAAAAGIAKILFFIFLVIFIVLLIMGLLAGS